MASLGDYYLNLAQAAHVSPEIMHRIASMSAGGFDCMPHNGAVITLLGICGLRHRESFLDIFVVAFADHGVRRHLRDHPERAIRDVLSGRSSAMKRMVLFAAIASAGFVAHAEGLRFVTAELPPYTFQVPPATVAEEPGPGQGLVHEAVQEMARRLNTSVAIEYMDWDGAQKLALGQPNVGILSITRTPEREDHYQWCCGS